MRRPSPVQTVNHDELAKITYLGLQFTLAILVTLVPDSYADAQIHPALVRLASILIGMVVLEPVLLAWHALSPAPRPTPTGHADLSE